MTTRLETQCCIAGGGPAGLMLGYLLARQGVETIVLEKHADFLRDFRGDTVHPSTLEILNELGLLERFLERPHQKTEKVSLHIGGKAYRLVDFTRLKVTCPFIAFMPQWEFLDFLADEARELSNFRLLMRAEATGLLRDGDGIVGLTADHDGEALEVRAPLTVAADGRGSTLRADAGLEMIEKGSAIDVLWMRLSRRDTDPDGSLGHIDAGGFLVLINRERYWQCAFVIKKGDGDAVRSGSLDDFRARIAAIAPFLSDRTSELQSWDDVKLLSVQIDRARTWWRDGFLAIGDAAHAMSPVGGVGINLAVQDAVAAARLLWRPLRTGAVGTKDLKRVQKRREFPARIVQSAQVFAQNNIILPAIEAAQRPKAPLPVRLLDRHPYLRKFPAMAVGLGPRPEHWTDG